MNGTQSSSSDNLLLSTNVEPNVSSVSNNRQSRESCNSETPLVVLSDALPPVSIGNTLPKKARNLAKRIEHFFTHKIHIGKSQKSSSPESPIIVSDEMHTESPPKSPINASSS